MDLSDSIIPKSDQLNAEDLLSGPRTVTVEKVTAGNAEQPVFVHLVEFPGRPFKPSKTVRRILVAAWGRDSSAYVGRRMTLYCDPTVRFGGIEVGGIRVSHLSNIDKRLNLALTVTRGKRAPYVVEPLTESQPVPETPKSQPVPDKGEKDPETEKARRAMWAVAHEKFPDESEFRAWIAKGLGLEPDVSLSTLTREQMVETTGHLRDLATPDGPNIASAAS